MTDKTIVIKEVAYGGSLVILYHVLNDSIDDWEPVKRGFKEMPHHDLRDSIDVLAQQLMQIVGFPSMHPSWGTYKLKKVKFGSNNKVTARIVFSHATLDMVTVDLPTTDKVPENVVEPVIEELKEYILGRKKAQGDLFDFEVPVAEYSEGDPELDNQENLAIAE